MLKPIYTEPENCQDCYKCIRECPVKAIMVEGNKASIIEERCIYCGHCTQVCPTGAKKVRDGLTRAKFTLSRHPGKVYMSLAPSYVSEFGDIPTPRLIAAIKRLGFTGVSETALGAEVVSAKTEEYIGESLDNIHISSACPVIVDYIRKYVPSLVENITPIVSPMIAHAMILRELYGEDIKVIFAGPCIGKKTESDNFGDLVDVAITFKDLSAWLDSEAELPITADLHKSDDVFVPYNSRIGAAYPIEGGMLAGLHKLSKPVHYMAFSGIDVIKNVLNELNPEECTGPMFLELLACSGGCVNGPAKLNSVSIARKRYDIIGRCETGDSHKDFSHLNLNIQFNSDFQKNTQDYTEIEIKGALATVGKTTAEDELNCSSCGYDTCRDFAVAMLNRRAEDNMCASYMRKIAHDKATVLLQKIPAGVILVNSDLKVVDMNRNFAAYMGDDLLSVYDLMPGMTGASINKVCSFEPFFRTAFATGEELRERRITDNGKTWLLSIYNLQPNRQVFGLLQSLNEPGVKKEWILEKAREVIRNHMTTVQKVAGLLGENAAYTDSTLRSIIEAYDQKEAANKELFHES
jgi:iron only hydrogenase large subunit-like protein